MTNQHNRSKILSMCLVAAMGTLLAASYTTGAIIPLTADIDGAQADMGNGTGSTATGSATMSLDTVSGLFSWDISWTPLLGNLTVMHFHGPAAPGFNAGVQVPISDTTSPSIGSATIDSGQQSDLLKGLWYINIHSDRNTGGEIRGQVVPEPVSVALFGIGLVSIVAFNRRRQQRQIAD